MLDACNGNIDIASYVQEARGKKQEAGGSRGGAEPPSSLLNVGARALPRPNPKAVQNTMFYWRPGTGEWRLTGNGDRK